jgi:hypothetical protein
MKSDGCGTIREGLEARKSALIAVPHVIGNVIGNVSSNVSGKPSDRKNARIISPPARPSRGAGP